MSPLVSSVFSETSIAVVVVLGIILIWVAYMIALLGGRGETVYKVSSVVNSLGTVSLTIMLVGGGIVNARIERAVRVGMVIMGVLLIVGFSLTTALSALTFGLY